jgi:pimeloyl-ACP methyl ester carboxylesterase
MLDAIAIPDGHLTYLDRGTGPLVVLLHGGVVDHRMWDEQVAAFADRHRVVAPDARGHGRSSTATTPFRHCDDLAVLLRHLDAGPAHLVGISMGGGTAVDTALEYPGLVASLVVSGTGTSEPDFREPWMLERFAEWARAEEARDIDAWLDVFLRIGAGPHRTLADVDPAIVERLRVAARNTVVEHASNGAPPLVPVTRTWERVPTLTQPVLAVAGGLDSDDHIAMNRRLAREVPNGRAATIEGAAHYPNMERPAEFDELVRRFLDGAATGPSR